MLTLLAEPTNQAITVFRSFNSVTKHGKLALTCKISDNKQKAQIVRKCQA